MPRPSYAQHRALKARRSSFLESETDATDAESHASFSTYLSNSSVLSSSISTSSRSGGGNTLSTPTRYLPSFSNAPIPGPSSSNTSTYAQSLRQGTYYAAPAPVIRQHTFSSTSRDTSSPLGFSAGLSGQAGQTGQADQSPSSSTSIPRLSLSPSPGSIYPNGQTHHVATHENDGTGGLKDASPRSAYASHHLQPRDERERERRVRREKRARERLEGGGGGGGSASASASGQGIVDGDKVRRRAARAERALRREERVKGSTLQGEGYDSVLRGLLRLAARRGWGKGASVIAGLGVVGVLRVVGMRMAWAVPSPRDALRLPYHPFHVYLGRLMTGPSHIISPSVLYLTTVISEIHLVWPIVLYWADNEARRTGKSGRSQVTAQLAILICPLIVGLLADTTLLNTALLAAGIAVPLLFREGNEALGVVCACTAIALNQSAAVILPFVVAWNVAMVIYGSISLGIVRLALNIFIGFATFVVVAVASTSHILELFWVYDLAEWPLFGPTIVQAGKVIVDEAVEDLISWSSLLTVLANLPTVGLIVYSAFSLRPRALVSPNITSDVKPGDSVLDITEPGPDSAPAQNIVFLTETTELTPSPPSPLLSLIPISYLALVIPHAIIRISTELAGPSSRSDLLPGIPLALLLACRGRPANANASDKSSGAMGSLVGDEAWTLGGIASGVLVVNNVLDNGLDQLALSTPGIVSLVASVGLLGLRLTPSETSATWMKRASDGLYGALITRTCIAIYTYLGDYHFSVGTPDWVGKVDGWMSVGVPLGLWVIVYVWAMRRLILDAWAAGVFAR